MKKLLLVSVSLLITLGQISAQEPIFTKKSKVLNLGIGLGSMIYTGTYYRTTIPPVSASLEFGVADNVLEKGSIGVGPYVGFAGNKYSFGGEVVKYTHVLIGARGSFHYPLVKKLDTYTGLLLGYDVVSSTGNVPNYALYSSGVIWSWYIGGRYWFNDKVAGLLELGYGIAYLNLGVAFKF